MIMVPGDIFDGGTIIEGPDKWNGVTFVCKYCGMEVYSRTEDLHYHKDGCGCKAAWEALKADIIARGASEKKLTNVSLSTSKSNVSMTER